MGFPHRSITLAVFARVRALQRVAWSTFSSFPFMSSTAKTHATTSASQRTSCGAVRARARIRPRPTEARNENENLRHATLDARPRRPRFILNVLFHDDVRRASVATYSRADISRRRARASPRKTCLAAHHAILTFVPSAVVPFGVRRGERTRFVTMAPRILGEQHSLRTRRR